MIGGLPIWLAFPNENCWSGAGICSCAKRSIRPLTTATCADGFALAGRFNFPKCYLLALALLSAELRSGSLSKGGGYYTWLEFHIVG